MSTIPALGCMDPMGSGLRPGGLGHPLCGHSSQSICLHVSGIWQGLQL